MKLNRLTFMKLAAAAMALPQPILLANGRKPVANVAMKGMLHREGAPPKEVFNIRLAQGQIEKMELTGSDGDAQIIVKLSKIKTLVFLGTVKDNPSNTEWEITTESGQEPIKMTVTTGTGNDQLLVKGLRSDGTTLSIPLSKCLKLELTAQGALHTDPSWPVENAAKK